MSSPDYNYSIFLKIIFLYFINLCAGNWINDIVIIMDVVNPN